MRVHDWNVCYDHARYMTPCFDSWQLGVSCSLNLEICVLFDQTNDRSSWGFIA